MFFTRSFGKVQLFIFGAITILFEVVFTRLASAYFQYHYAFLILSLAMLSFCLSGILYQKSSEKKRVVLFDKFRILLPLSFILFLFLFVFSVTTGLIGWGGWFLVSSIFGFGILFICGFLVVMLLDKEKGPEFSYGINLFGGGVGGLVAVGILSYGSPYAALAICAILGLIGIKPLLEKRKMILYLCLILAVAIPFLVMEVKAPNRVWEDWNAFSMVSVENIPSPNLMWGGTIASKDTLPSSVQLRIDSDAATAIIIEPEKSKALSGDITHAGYFFLQNGSRVSILGSGGGRDVVMAKDFNLSYIKAVEINPLVIQAVDEFSPKTYEGVDLILADGREELASSSGEFDLVQLSLVDSWAAVSSGSFALTENYLYTKESFGTYLASLDDQGILSVTYWDRYLNKFLALSFASLTEIGVESPSENVLVFHKNYVSTILIKKTPWTEQEITLAKNVADKYEYEIVPVAPEYSETVNTDDSPFFFFNEQGFWILASLMLALLMLISMGRKKLGLEIERSDAHILLFFALIGFGFMSIESIFIQRFFLILHNPTLTVAVVFTSFLVFGGLGSILSNRISLRYSILLFPLLLVFALGWGIAIETIYQLGLLARLGISIALIAPVAIMMGTFFPVGLAHLKRRKLNKIGSAWTINGIASVFAPIVAILVAVYFGFGVVIVTSAIAYLLAWKIWRNGFC